MAFTLSVSYRGKTYDVRLAETAATLRQLGHEVATVTGVSFETAKLLAPGVKGGLVPALAAEHDLIPPGLTSGARVLLLGSSAADVQALRSATEIPGLASFEHEMRRATLRKRQGAGSAVLSAPTGTYTFGSFEAWQRPGLYPPPSVALQLLYRLAHDHGIRGIMEAHQYKVGLLSEMPPEGKVGISPVCVLGVNINAGQEISLRLRTDDLRGFRKYENIRLTLIHELAHMEHSEHEAPFKALNSQLGREVQAILAQHAGGSIAALGGATSAATRSRGHHDRFMQDDDDAMFGGGSGMGVASSSGNGMGDVMAATARSSGRTLRALAGADVSPTGSRAGAATAATAREAAAQAALQRLGASAAGAVATDSSGGAADVSPTATPLLPAVLSRPGQVLSAGHATAPGSDSDGGESVGRSTPASDSDIDPSGGLREFEREDVRTQEAEQAVLELEGRSAGSDAAVPSSFGQQHGAAAAHMSEQADAAAAASVAALVPECTGGVQPMDVDSAAATLVEEVSTAVHPPAHLVGSIEVQADSTPTSQLLSVQDAAERNLEPPTPHATVVVPVVSVAPPVVVRLSSLHLASSGFHATSAADTAPPAVNDGSGANVDTSPETAISKGDVNPHTASQSHSSCAGDDDVMSAKYAQAWAALRSCVDACGGDASQALSTLQTLQTLLGNVVHQPAESKFKTVKLSNGALRRKLGAGIASAVEVLKTAGFAMQSPTGAPTNNTRSNIASGWGGGVASDGAGSTGGIVGEHGPHGSSLVDVVLMLNRNDPGLVWLVLAAVSAAIEEVEQQLQLPAPAPAQSQQHAIGSTA